MIKAMSIVREAEPDVNLVLSCSDGDFISNIPPSVRHEGHATRKRFTDSAIRVPRRFSPVFIRVSAFHRLKLCQADARLFVIYPVEIAAGILKVLMIKLNTLTAGIRMRSTLTGIPALVYTTSCSTILQVTPHQLID